MSQSFLVSTRPEPSLGAAVFAIGSMSPLENLRDVEQELREKQVAAGKVLFDLLLANGNKLNRFFVADFDGEHFAKRRLVSGDEKYSAYSDVSAKFLQKHVDELDSSLLTKAMRFALRKGLPL